MLENELADFVLELSKQHQKPKRKPRPITHPRPNEGKGNLPRAERNRRPIVTKRRKANKAARKSRQINRRKSK